MYVYAAVPVDGGSEVVEDGEDRYSFHTIRMCFLSDQSFYVFLADGMYAKW
jgi:hypothetical protein